VPVARPIDSLSDKDVRKLSRLFKMLDLHLSQPLFDRQGDKSDIGSAYDSFVGTTNRLNGFIQQVAERAINEAFGIRYGMTLRISRGGSPIVIKMVSAVIANGDELFSSPECWEWRLIGESEAHGAMVELPLRGELAIERLALNGQWMSVVSSLKQDAIVINQ